MTSSLPLIQELARAAGSDVTKDQLVVLFEREVAESVGKIEEFDDTENTARLLSLARETQQEIIPGSASQFIANGVVEN
ncbi:hypothetical protein Tco_0090777 [Tanacetum coccineum]